jgi:exonuclease SbcD
MRLLHTSDWHLGVSLEGMSMLEHQRQALDFLVDLVEQEDVDAVLISGDVYDRALPGVEAVALFEEALVAMARRCTVVVTSGNHDSAIRLGFGSRLYGDRLHFRTSIERIADPVTLTDEFGSVHIYGLPYLEPDLTRHQLAGEPVARSHEAVLGAAMDLVRDDLDRRRSQGSRPRSVVLAHAFIVGSTGEGPRRSDSERDIRVGNVDSAPATVFSGIDYTALGHLHGPQQPAAPGPGVVRYSGSPLRYSFSEAGHSKSVTLVDLGPDGVKSVSTVPVPQPRPMVELTGSLADLLDDELHAEHRDAWLKITVTDAVRPENMHAQLRDRFPHLITSYHRGPASNGGVAPLPESADPMEVVEQFLAAALGEAPRTEQTGAVRGHFEALLREGRSA